MPDHRRGRPENLPKDDRPPSPHRNPVSSKIFRLLLGRHESDLLEDMGGRRLLGHEPKLQMIDNPVHGGIIGDEGDDLVNLADHLGPAAM